MDSYWLGTSCKADKSIFTLKPCIKTSNNVRRISLEDVTIAKPSRSSVYMMLLLGIQALLAKADTRGGCRSEYLCFVGFKSVKLLSPLASLHNITSSSALDILKINLYL